MSERIIFTRPDGSVSVVQIMDGIKKTRAEAIAQAIPNGTTFETISDADLPDRVFRNAWRKTGAAINVDIPHAKEIAHAKRRLHRNRLLGPLDLQTLIPAEKTEAERQRKIIRTHDADRQVRIDDAVDVEGLKSIVDEM